MYTEILNNIFCKHISSDCMSKIHVEDDFYKIADVDEQLKALNNGLVGQ